MKQFPDPYQFIDNKIPYLNVQSFPGTIDNCRDFSVDDFEMIAKGKQCVTAMTQRLINTLRYPETSLPYPIAFMMQSLLLGNVWNRKAGEKITNIHHPQQPYILSHINQGSAGFHLTIKAPGTYKIIISLAEAPKSGRRFWWNGTWYDEQSVAGSLRKHIHKLEDEILHDANFDQDLDTISSHELARQLLLTYFHDLGEAFSTDIPFPLKKDNPILQEVEKIALHMLIQRINGYTPEQKKQLQDMLQYYEGNKATDIFKRRELQSLGNEIKTFQDDIIHKDYSYAAGPSIVLDLLHAVTNKFSNPEAQVSFGDNTTLLLKEIPSLQVYIKEKQIERQHAFHRSQQEINLNKLPPMIRHRRKNKRTTKEIINTIEKNLDAINDDRANLQTI